MKNLVIGIFLMFTVSANAAGTYIVKGATITSIANTGGNLENFTIWVAGGTGVCANKGITFPRTAAGSSEIFSRAYSAALTAFASGEKIWVYDYTGSSCSNAAFIRLLK